MTLVDKAALTAALAERDAARAEVARLRAAVEAWAYTWLPEWRERRDSQRFADLRKALAATEDQP